jgi:hypothetical protein
VECTDVLLFWKNEADESEGVLTVYRGIQFIQTGLHPFGISEWSEGWRSVRVTRRRLCGWKKTGDVLQLKGRKVQGVGFARGYQEMAEIIGKIISFAIPARDHGGCRTGTQHGRCQVKRNGNAYTHPCIR